MYNPKQSVFIYMEHIDTKAEIGRKNISMIIYPLGITRLNLTNNAVMGKAISILLARKLRFRGLNCPAVVTRQSGN